MVIRAKGNAFGIVGRSTSILARSEMLILCFTKGWSLGCGSVSLAAPSMFGTLGPNGFYIHAVFNLFALVIVYFFYPETTCRTLEEVRHLLAVPKSYC